MFEKSKNKLKEVKNRMEHGPFKSKGNAKDFASDMRKKGFCATLYKAKGKWKVSVTKK